LAKGRRRRKNFLFTRFSFSAISFERFAFAAVASSCQFHQHFTRTFFADIFAPKNYKAKM